MTERERFEQWLFNEFPSAENFNLVFYPDDNRYNHHPTQARWEAWQASKCVAVPEGYVIVPKEPTCEMVEAGMGNFDFPLDNGRFSNNDLIFAYRAMIEA